jgi:hypothetical protein
MDAMITTSFAGLYRVICSLTRLFIPATYFDSHPPALNSRLPFSAIVITSNFLINTYKNLITTSKPGAFATGFLFSISPGPESLPHWWTGAGQLDVLEEMPLQKRITCL